jgi:quercetin dioxygenase-like cupin family protein
VGNDRAELDSTKALRRADVTNDNHKAVNAPETSRARPYGAGSIIFESDNKLAHISGKSLKVLVVDIPPGGKVPEHHHGGPTLDYVLSGTVSMQLDVGSGQVYEAGQALYEYSGSVHLDTTNLSKTKEAKIMLICVCDDAAHVVNFHDTPAHYAVTP